MGEFGTFDFTKMDEIFERGYNLQKHLNQNY